MASQAVRYPLEPPQSRVPFTSGSILLLPAGGDVLVESSPGEGEGNGEKTTHESVEEKRSDTQEK